MTINKTSGETLTFEEIENEFGQIPGANNRKLGSYRVNYSNTDSGGGLSNAPLDEGVPQSGPIKFSDFYGKKLNMIIDYYSGSNQNRTGTGGGSDNNQIATWKYQNESSKVNLSSKYG